MLEQTLVATFKNPSYNSADLFTRFDERFLEVMIPESLIRDGMEVINWMDEDVLVKIPVQSGLDALEKLGNIWQIRQEEITIIPRMEDVSSYISYMYPQHQYVVLTFQNGLFVKIRRVGTEEPVNLPYLFFQRADAFQQGLVNQALQSGFLVNLQYDPEDSSKTVGVLPHTEEPAIRILVDVVMKGRKKTILMKPYSMATIRIPVAKDYEKSLQEIQALRQELISGIQDVSQLRLIQVSQNMSGVHCKDWMGDCYVLRLPVSEAAPCLTHENIVEYERSHDPENLGLVIIFLFRFTLIPNTNTCEIKLPDQLFHLFRKTPWTLTGVSTVIKKQYPGAIVKVINLNSKTHDSGESFEVK